MDLHRESSGDFSREDYEQYRLLIHKVARRHYGILLHSDFPEDYEDVFQSVALSFLMAKAKYNPDTGFKFTTYAVASADRNFLTALQRRKKKLPLISLETLKCKDDDVSFWQEIIADESNDGYKPSMGMKLAEATKKLKRLSQAARIVIRELIVPSDEIKKAHKEKLEYAKKARETGYSAPMVREDIDYDFIFRYYKVPVKNRKAIYDEIKEVFEL